MPVRLQFYIQRLIESACFNREHKLIQKYIVVALPYIFFLYSCTFYILVIGYSNKSKLEVKSVQAIKTFQMNIIPIPLLPSKTFVLYILFFPVFFSRCDGLVYNISFLHICWYFVSGSWRTEFSGRTAHSSLVINLNLFKIEK